MSKTANFASWMMVSDTAHLGGWEIDLSATNLGELVREAFGNLCGPGGREGVIRRPQLRYHERLFSRHIGPLRAAVLEPKWQRIIRLAWSELRCYKSLRNIREQV